MIFLRNFRMHCCHYRCCRAAAARKIFCIFVGNEGHLGIDSSCLLFNETIIYYESNNCLYKTLHFSTLKAIISFFFNTRHVC